MRTLVLAAMVVVLISLEARAERSALLEERLRQCGIELVDDRDVAEKVDGETVTGSKLSANLAREFDSLLVGEFASLPPGFFSSAGLKRIVALQGMKVDNEPQSVLMDHANGVFYYDAAEYWWNRHYSRRVLAMFLTNMLLMRTGDDQFSKLAAAWRENNPPGFKYRNEGGTGFAGPGFLTGHAQNNELNDMMTVGGYLLVEPWRVQRRAAADRHLAGKAAVLRRFLKQAVPEMDDAWWDKHPAERTQIRALDRARAAERKGSDIEEQLAKLAADYEIEVHWTRAHSAGREFDPPSPKQIAEYAPVVIRELGRYPVDFIQALGVQRVVIAGKSSTAGLRGTYNYNTDTLYLVAPENKTDESHRWAVHHELFHPLDRIEDGTLELDKEWDALNAPGFRYAYTGQERAGFDEKVVGFVSEYARSAVGEDKAETFAALMIRYAALQERCVRDKVLAAKVERMKATLRRFSPRMDENFWEQSLSTSMSLTQRWVPGRYKTVAYYEVEDLSVAGVVRQWGTFTYDMVVAAPGIDDNQVITLEPVAISSSLRAAGMTLTYDSTDPTAEQDRSLQKVFEPMLRMPLHVTIGPDLRVRKLKGYDEYVEKVREEQDEPSVIRARNGKVDVENGIRFGTLPAINRLLPAQGKSVRAGDRWNGAIEFSFRSLPEGDIPVEVTLVGVENNAANLSFVGRSDRKTKPLDSQGKPVGEDVNIAAYHKGEIVLDVRSGMLRSMKQHLRVVSDNISMDIRMNVRIEPSD